MQRIKLAAKRSSVIVLSLLLLGAFPASALADTGDPSTPPADPSASTTTPAASTPGPNKPNGAGANTYVYDSTTGLWCNSYYCWNPTTKQTTPITPPTYSYNPATGHWDTTQWVWDPTQGKYVPNVVSVTTPPVGAAVVVPDSTTNTGPDSNNTINNTGNTTGIFNGFYNASISNTLNQNASTGNAIVSGNTTGGSATSGNASDIANIVNMLQSTGGILQGGNLATFTYNVNGNVNGDLLLNPSNISTTGPNSTNTDNTTQNTNLTINSQANGQINNNINLDANSGNAAVTGNTTGGNATSGSASAVADIANFIDSIVGAQSGFLGVININGNLNGDILLPQDTLNSLIAASGPYATIDTSQISNNNLTANLSNNQSIHNNVNSTATTGNASVSDNTTGGNATSGAASNKLNVLNLTGSNVIGKDALLVFVNVMGNWVGMIVNAPAGSTAAALGGDTTTNTGPNSTNTTTTTNNTNTTINEKNNEGINNNINLKAKSGDANVSDNTTGGNATTGNASTSANVLNCEDCNLNLTDWLGILFINVFGTWNGSFGVNTDAGNPPVGGMGGGSATAPQTKVFQLSGGSGNNLHFSAVNNNVLNAFAGDGGTSTNNQKSVVLGTTTHKTPKAPQTVSAQSGTFPVILLSVGLIGFSWIIGSTPQVRKSLKGFGKPVLNGLQAASARLFTFLF